MQQDPRIAELEELIKRHVPCKETPGGFSTNYKYRVGQYEFSRSWYDAEDYTNLTIAGTPVVSLYSFYRNHYFNDKSKLRVNDTDALTAAIADIKSQLRSL